MMKCSDAAGQVIGKASDT